MIEDDYKRLEDLARVFEPKLQARFLAVVRQIQDTLALETIEQLIAQGRIEQALTIAESAALGLANAISSHWNELFSQSAQDTAEFLANARLVIVNFDQTNQGAISSMQANKLNLVRELAQEQRLTTQQAILDGIRGGLNPNQVAREVRNSIGLTQRQQAAVTNYRRLLGMGSREALQRELRDARFDLTVRRAADGTKALSQEQIDKMVARYQSRYLDYRSRVIARTEATRAAQQGNHQMFVQAVEDGHLIESELERRWHAARDERTRHSHQVMQGQLRPLRVPFSSGNGNPLMYPGDPTAPGDDTIQCRCAVSTRLKSEGTVLAPI